MDRTLVAKQLLHLAKSIQGDGVVAKNVKADDATYIADTFTRYLLGDRKDALRLLGVLSNHGIGPESSDPREYNQQFAALFRDIYNAIKKNT